MAPIVDGLEEKYAASVKFVRLEFDDPTQNKQARQLGVFGHPACVLVRADGTVAARFIGEVARAKLDAAIVALIGP
ncbi:MAG: hypothetical protein HY259_05615 [Chloroflexi bacterium]|nr:hypothetical protein [Chloroflexota bacterium]